MKPELLQPASGPLTSQIVSDVVLLAIGLEIKPSWIDQWSEMERLVVYDWAMRDCLRASDNPVKRRPMPWLVRDRVLDQPGNAGVWHVDDPRMVAGHRLSVANSRIMALESQIAMLEAQLDAAQAEIEDAGDATVH